MIPSDLRVSAAGDIRALATTRFWLALVESSLPVEEVSEEARAGVLASVAQFVAGQLEAVDRPYRVAFSLGCVAFRASVRLREGEAFERLSLERRRLHFSAWAWGRLRLGRQLFRPLRATAALAFFEHPAVVS